MSRQAALQSRGKAGFLYRWEETTHPYTRATASANHIVVGDQIPGPIEDTAPRSLSQWDRIILHQFVDGLWQQTLQKARENGISINFVPGKAGKNASFSQRAFEQTRSKEIRDAKELIRYTLRP